jgi:hypothetical protein
MIYPRAIERAAAVPAASKSVAADNAAVPNPKFVLAVAVFARSDRLFAESNAPDNVA